MILESKIELARATAVKYQEPCWINADSTGVLPGLTFRGDDVRDAHHDLKEVLESSVWYAYPSGLVLPAFRVLTFWQFPPRPGRYRRSGFDYYLGTAEQAIRAVHGWKIAPDVVPVPLDLIHGTCVREEWTYPDGTVGYVMIQARSFPHWCGV